MKQGERASAIVGGVLHGAMAFCRRNGISFEKALAEARREFNKEVREAALTDPLPDK